MTSITAVGFDLNERARIIPHTLDVEPWQRLTQVLLSHARFSFYQTPVKKILLPE